MNNRDQITTASWINIIAGIWLIIAPFVLNYSGYARSNDVILGIIITIVAIIRMFNPINSRGLSWVNAILGLWLIFAPFILGYLTNTPRWNDVILGVIVLADSIWNFTSAQQESHHLHVGRA